MRGRSATPQRVGQRLRYRILLTPRYLCPPRDRGNAGIAAHTPRPPPPLRRDKQQHVVHHGRSCIPTPRWVAAPLPLANPYCTPSPYTASRRTGHSVACVPLSCTTHPLTSAASSLRPASLRPARWSAPRSTAGVIYHPLPSQAVEKTLTTPGKVRPQVLKYVCMPLVVGPALSSIHYPTTTTPKDLNPPA